MLTVNINAGFDTYTKITIKYKVVLQMHPAVSEPCGYVQHISII